MLDAICNLPTYMLNKLEDATKCGNQEGKLAAIVATVILVFLFIVVVVSIQKEENRKKREIKNYKTSITVYMYTLVIFVLLILAAWTVIPSIIISMKEVRFKENELMINNLVKGGMSKEAARVQVIQKRQLEEKIEAQKEAARIQARATDRQTNKLTNATDRQTDALLKALEKN